jgi:small subunit ribosomal protein S14
MAKKSKIEREKRLENTVKKYKNRREKLLQDIKRAELVFESNNLDNESHVESTSTTQISELYRKFNRIPRDASPSRRRNRCWATGRSRGFYRDFGLSRHVIREMGNEGLLPGLRRSNTKLCLMGFVASNISDDISS